MVRASSSTRPPTNVIPAVVSFVASDTQVSPKAVETKDERAKQRFRVNLRIDPQVVKTLGGKVETGLPGAGFVRTKPDVIWPPELQIKLPPAPVAQEASPAPALEQQPAAPAASPIAQQPAPTPAPAAAPEALAPSSVAQDSAPASTAAPAVGAPKTWVCSATGSCDGRCGATTHTHACPAGAAGARADRQSAHTGFRGGRGVDDIVRPCRAGRDGGVRSPERQATRRGVGAARG